MQELPWAPHLDLFRSLPLDSLFFFSSPPRRFSVRRRSLQGDKGDGVGALKL